MIEWIRKYANSWVVRVFFLVLALCFAFLWGGHDALRMLGVSKDSTVATVGGHKITAQALGLEIGREMIRFKLQDGVDLTEEDVRKAGIDRQILQRMIVEQLITLEAKKLGIDVSDAYAAKTIKASKIFQSEDGRFSKARFEYVVNHLGFQGERDYVPYIKGELLRSRFVSALTGKVPVSEEYIKQLYAWSEQIRTAKVMIVEPSKIEIAEKPTDNDLRDFYGKHQKLFVAPEKRTFTILLIDGKQFKKGIEINPSDIDALYEVNKVDKYKNISPQEAKKQIKAAMEEEKQEENVQRFAKELEKAFDGGEQLPALAKKHNLTLKQYKDATQRDVPTTHPDALYYAQAFAQEENTLSHLEKGKDDLYFFTYVEGVTPPKKLTFHEALAQVKDAYIKAKQQEKSQELALKISQQLNQGGLFDAVAAQHQLKVMTMKSNRHAVLPPFQLTLTPVALQKLFNLKQNQFTLLPHVTDTDYVPYLIVQVTEIKSADPAKAKKEDLDKFRDIIKLQMQSDIIDEFLQYLQSKYKVEINERFFKESKATPSES